MNRLYDDVLAFENALHIRFDYVLHVGDFGIWPDRSRIDRAARRHDGAGDFPTWLHARRMAPRRTVFIKGNHEDFEWLDNQSTTEVLPNLIYLPNGSTIELTGAGSEPVRVGGIGGCHGPSDYECRSDRLQGRGRRHFTKDEIERLVDGARQVSLDIVLTHDAPGGIRFRRHQGGEFVSEATGLAELLTRVRPRVCFFGHHHTRVRGEIAGVLCIGLNKVTCPGNLIAIEFGSPTSRWSIVGEWPLTSSTTAPGR